MSDPCLPRVLQLASRLISFNTESARSNLELTDFVTDYLRQLGVSVLAVPNAEGDKLALFATIGPQCDGGVVLSGHTDVVPVEGQAWSRNPFAAWCENDRLYGRGACDMKGFDAVCLAMVPEFLVAPLKRPVHLLLSYDEEVTCAGSLDLIRRLGHDLPRPSAVIVGEPTMMEVADAHKSVSTYRTRIRGHESHSAKIHQGVSAVHVGAELVSGLLKIGEAIASDGPLSDRFDPACSTVHVGMMSGGTARNIMARDCAFYWEFRGLPGAPLRMAYDRFMALSESVARARFAGFADCAIETDIEVEIPALAPDTGSAAETLALRLAHTNRTIAVPYATEAGQFQTHGLATIVCGPGSIEQAHQPDEYVDMDQLASCIAFMRRLVHALS